MRDVAVGPRPDDACALVATWDRFVIDELVGWQAVDTGNQQFVDDESGLWGDVADGLAMCRTGLDGGVWSGVENQKNNACSIMECSAAEHGFVEEQRVEGRAMHPPP